MENKATNCQSFQIFELATVKPKIDKATSIHHYHDTYEIVLFEKADFTNFYKRL